MTQTPIIKQKKYFEIMKYIYINKPSSKDLTDFIKKLTIKNVKLFDKDMNKTPQNISMVIQNLQKKRFISRSGYGRYSKYEINIDGFFDNFLEYYYQNTSEYTRKIIDSWDLKTLNQYLFYEILLNMDHYRKFIAKKHRCDDEKEGKIVLDENNIKDFLSITNFKSIEELFAFLKDLTPLKIQEINADVQNCKKK